MNVIRRAQRGTPVAESAGFHNMLVDSVLRSQTQDHINAVRRGTTSSFSSTVRVRNLSGATIQRFGVLVISGVAIEPAANEVEFVNRPILDCVVPDGVHLNFVVVQQPIASGAIGRAIVSGMTVARLAVFDEAVTFADSASGSSVLVAGASGQAEILWREGGLGEQWAVVRIGNSVSFGAGVTNLAIVVTPSANGEVAFSYTVDIYGTTLESLSEPPILTDQIAVQPQTSHTYYRGEVVGVRRIGDTLGIQKLLTLPVAYTAHPGQVGLRLIRDGRPQNFIVDLIDCLPFFNNGVQLSGTTMHFNYSGFAGHGGIGVTLSIPVRMQPEWEICQPFMFGALPPDGVTQASNGVTTITSLGGGLFGRSPKPNQVFQSGSQFFRLQASGELWCLEFTGSFINNDDGTNLPGTSLSNQLWPGLVLPSIDGAVDSNRVCLRYSGFTFGYNQSMLSTVGPATNVAENISAYRVFSSNITSRAGTYDLLITPLTELFGAGPPSVPGPIVLS